MLRFFICNDSEMRIAFMGKGGSGKTTLASTFIQWIRHYHRKHSLRVFDVDINSHLYTSLTQESFPIDKYLEGNFDRIAELLEPRAYAQKHLYHGRDVGSFPMTQDTHYLQPGQFHPLISEFGQEYDGATYFTFGNYTLEENPQHKCYHGLLNAYELIIHRTRDTRDDIIVADTTAGIDNIGTSLFMAYDLVVFVVEPTQRSVDVLQRYLQFSQIDPSQLLIVANKIRTEQDESFVRSQCAHHSILILPFDRSVYRDGS